MKQTADIPEPEPEPELEPYAAFIGIDRADTKIDTFILSNSGEALGHQVVDIKPENLRDWVLGIAIRFPGGRVAICIEQPCANLISFLSQYPWIDLYPINPATLKRWREAFTVSLAKDDKGDSRHLAELVHERYHKLKLWAPDDPQTRRLRALTEDRRKIVAERTRLTNRLTAKLKDYFPLALEIIGKDLHGRLACDFLRKWPTLDKLQRAKESTIRQFYHKHASRRKETIDKRIEAIRTAIPITTDETTLEISPMTTNSILAQLDAIRTQVKKFDAEIETSFTAHEDYAIFASLPGAGSNYGARLAGSFGTDRSRYPDAGSAQNYIGVAPVTKQSGNSKKVIRRFAYHKFHRHCQSQMQSDQAEPEGINTHRMGRPEHHEKHLGTCLVRTTARERSQPLHSAARPRLQMVAHYFPLLARAQPLRRSQIHRTPKSSRESTYSQNRSRPKSIPAM